MLEVLGKGWIGYTVVMRQYSAQFTCRVLKIFWKKVCLSFVTDAFQAGTKKLITGVNPISLFRIHYFTSSVFQNIKKMIISNRLGIFLKPQSENIV